MFPNISLLIRFLLLLRAPTDDTRRMTVVNNKMDPIFSFLSEFPVFTFIQLDLILV